MLSFGDFEILAEVTTRQARRVAVQVCRRNGWPVERVDEVEQKIASSALAELAFKDAGYKPVPAVVRAAGAFRL